MISIIMLRCSPIGEREKNSAPSYIIRIIFFNGRFLSSSEFFFFCCCFKTPLLFSTLKVARKKLPKNSAALSHTHIKSLSVHNEAFL